MKMPPPLIALWLIATLLVDAAVSLWTTNSGLFLPPFSLLIGLALGQISLLALWAAMSALPWPTRFVTVAAGLALWKWALRSDGPIGLSWLCFITEVLLIVAIMTVARLAGWRIEDRGQPPAAARARARFQYSFARLFQVVTGAAIYFAVVEKASYPRSMWLGMCALAAAVAALAVAALWATLGSRCSPLRLAVLCGLTFGLSQAFAKIFGEPFWELFVVLACQTLYMVLSLLVFRQCGYRLARQPRSAAPEPEPNAGCKQPR